METVWIRDWKKVGYGIRDKHPGSATLTYRILSSSDVLTLSINKLLFMTFSGSFLMFLEAQTCWAYKYFFKTG
jgi:hypothetical protein